MPPGIKKQTKQTKDEDKTQTKSRVYVGRNTCWSTCPGRFRRPGQMEEFSFKYGLCLLSLKWQLTTFPPPAFPSGVIAAATVAKTTRLLLFTLEWQIKTI